MKLKRYYVDSFTGQILPKKCILLFQEENLKEEMKQMRDDMYLFRINCKNLESDLKKARKSLSSKEKLMQTLRMRKNVVIRKIQLLVIIFFGIITYIGLKLENRNYS